VVFGPILNLSSRGKGVFPDYFEVKNGLLGIFTFPERLPGKAISYHRRIAEMKKATDVLRLVLIAILFTGLIAPLSTALAKDSKENNSGYENVITHLEELLESSPDLKNDIEKVLRLQDNCSYYWNNKDLKYFVNFFNEWLVYNPQPWAGPQYIQPFDEMANSEGGEILFNNNVFSSWFVEFLDARGQYLGTPQSLEKGILNDWKSFPAVQLDSYKPPNNQEEYKSFNDIFLRVPKKPFKVDGKDDPSVLDSPASGKIHQIYAKNVNDNFKVKRDVINIRQSLNNSPHAEKFIGGKIVDILLWFTDYHYFHAPISGEIIEVEEYAGSYNYNFQNVNWYKALAKHKRVFYIIKSEKFGLVAMIPVGFWGVGSIITDDRIKEGYFVKKGERMGHFGYGGSSILLVFEPDKIKFENADIEKDWIEVKPGSKIGNAQ
jgi:phosphatidylserine decarboxylase